MRRKSETKSASSWRPRARRPRRQRDVLRDVMLSADECDAWLTLDELAAMTRYPAASISAQLRHLKKPQFGNYEVEKQLRTAAHREDGQGAVWEYRLTRRRRIVVERRPVRKTGRRAASAARVSEPALPAASEDCSPAMPVC